MRIKDLPTLDRPRERVKVVGIENISNEELLAIILKTGTKNYSVKEMASQILTQLKEFQDLEHPSLELLKNIKGIGEVKRIELLASIELGRRLFLKKERMFQESLNNSQMIYQNSKYLFAGKKQEYFYCLYLDNKNKIIERKLLFMGTINRSIVHPREIFKEAYLASASKFVCLHNHPSGDIMPSMEDVYLTKNLIKIGQMQGILLMDHLIIGRDNYYSFYDENRDLFI